MIRAFHKYDGLRPQDETVEPAGASLRVGIRDLDRVGYSVDVASRKAEGPAPN